MFLNTSVDRDITISGHRHTNINIAHVSNNRLPQKLECFVVEKCNQNQRTETIIKYWFESLKRIRSLLTPNF